MTTTPMREVVTIYDRRGDAKRHWLDDLAHENGNYSCRCHSCGCTFQGHKRRITCKVCHGKT